MPSPNKLNNLNRLRFLNVAGLLTHAEAVSAEIKEKQPRKEQVIVRPPLSEFKTRVKELAPRFFNVQHSPKKVALELLAENGSNRLTTREINKLARRVNQVIQQLKARGELPLSTIQNKPRNPTRNIVSNEAVAPYLAKVNSAAKIASIRYRHLLTFEEAQATALEGVLRGLELYDPGKNRSQKGWISMYVAMRLKRLARQRIREQKRTISLSTPRNNDDEHTLEDQIGTAAFDPALINKQMNVILRHPRIRAIDAMVYALHAVYGHSKREIARHYDVWPNVIRFRYNKVQQILSEMEEGQTKVQKATK